MSSAPHSAVNFCYRHPDRQSFVLCQRCGRTICAECQTPAPVGVHCPECMAEARASAPRTTPRIIAAVRHRGAPVVTYSIIALCVVVWIAQLLTSGAVTQALLYFPPYTESEPWRMLTSAFVHSVSSPFHILFNMYALWLFGGMLEGLLGRARFLLLYVLSGIGGSVAVLWLSPVTPVVGASGAVFGLFAAFFVVQRHLGRHSMQLIVVIGLNLAIGFLVPNISWQGHLGGLITGALIALVYVSTRRRAQRTAQVLGVVAVAAGLVALTVVGWLTLLQRVFG